MTDKEYWYWFTSMLDIYPKKQRELMKFLVHPKELHTLKESVVEKYLSKNQMERFRATKNPDQILQSYHRLEQEGIRYILISEGEYPLKLKDISDAPYGIFRKGPHVDASLRIAIVGSRRPSIYGVQMGEYFAKALAQKGVLIVSGLAMGIDARAHIGAMKADGITAGVLGCGINQVYPVCNKSIFTDVLHHGCIYSEYGLDTKPLPEFFPQRNRIISGMCDGVLVIEAKKRSGSLITADCALDQNREVFAIPGNINSPLSHGCNHLIAQGAKLIESPEDILNEFPNYKTNSRKVSLFPENGLASNEKMVYDTLSFVPKHFDEIYSKVDLSISGLIQVLFYLEEKGYIEQTSRNYYIKKIL